MTPFTRIRRRLGAALGRPRPIDDRRGNRLMAVIHCHLNQNARDAGAACSPAITRELLELCLEHRTGILQMPCPEAAALGLERRRPPGESIRGALDTPEGRATCRRLAEETVATLVQYRDHGCQVTAIVGGNPQSPGCAVHGGTDVPLTGESGLFMLALEAAAQRHGLAVPFLPFRDADPTQRAADSAAIGRLLGRSPP
ncbi:MAG TPA: hypothetical protein ENK50_11040 [Sedimenticola sp.]|nr:hypothetical protein [Sedimenticola sp.]